MSALRIGGLSAPEMPKSVYAEKKSRADGSKESVSSDKVAGELESYFMRQILAEAHKSSDDKNSLDGGFAGGTFHDMLDGAMADSMAKGQGLGLKKVIADSLQRNEESNEINAAQANRIKGESMADAVARSRALKEPR